MRMKDIVKNGSLESSTTEELTPIQQFYYGKNIFITGVTGFVGKVLLEKILRCCPGIGMVYLLIRPKRGLNTDERIDKILQLELFDKARKKYPNLKTKTQVIYGDMEKPRLGISDEDALILVNNVDIVFHSAARVLWNDTLKVSTEHNVHGTQELLTFIKSFRNIIGFVHVSTSYVHREPDFTVLEEVPKMKISPQQLTDLLTWLDDDAIAAITPSIIEGKFTTYMFTKAVGEVAIQEQRGELPTAIVRPCNISPTLDDPFPGWGDTIQGVQGLFIAAAKGFLRTLWSVPGLKVNLVPVDTLVNTLLATAWHLVTSKTEDLVVVNCVVDYDKLPLGNEGLLQEVLKKRDKYPLANIYRYPDFTLYYNRWFYYIHCFFDHYIPAVIGDTLLFVFTGKTLMLRLYKKINFLFGVFITVGKEPWICEKGNYNRIMNSMSKKDSEVFKMNLDNMDWFEYIDDMLQTGRRILGREPDSNLAYAKKKAKIWWSVTTTLKWCFILYFINYFATMFFSHDDAYRFLGFKS